MIKAGRKAGWFLGLFALAAGFGWHLFATINDALVHGLDADQWRARYAASWGFNATHRTNFPPTPAGKDGPYTWVPQEKGWRVSRLGASQHKSFSFLSPLRSCFLPVYRSPRLLPHVPDSSPVERRVEYGPWTWGFGSSLGYTVLSDLLYRNTGSRILYAWIGSATSSELTTNDLCAAKARYGLAKQKSMGVVSTSMSTTTSRDDVAAAMVLVKAETRLPHLAETTQIHYRPVYSDVENIDDKHMPLAAACNVILPIGGAGYGAAMTGQSTERQTIHERIAKPASTLNGSARDVGYRAEFVRHHTALLIPADHDVVVEQMSRPSQVANRNAVDSVLDIFEPGLKQAFIKSEPTQVGKPARNICTVSAQRLYVAAGYTIALAQHFQTLPYWVWGCGSGATARRYHETCRRHAQMMESDYSKFDASLPPFFHDMHTMLYSACFAEWQTMDDAQRDVLLQEMRTATGQIFYVGHGRLSGQNETALWNTFDQAFLQYASFRDHGFGESEAWNVLNQCLLGGDDGLVPHLGQSLVHVSQRFGMKVVVRVFDSNTPCRFLGRIYPNGRDSADSYYDLQSFLERFHILNISGSISCERALVSKAYGLSVTDANCPLIKSYIRSVFDAYPRVQRAIPREADWWLSHYDLSDPYPFGDHDRDSILAFTAAQTGTSVEALLELEAWLDENPFFVGSTLPALLVEGSSGVDVGVGAKEVWGVVFGVPGPAPPLPRLTVALRKELKLLAPLALQDPSRRASMAASIASGARPCSDCGLYGHARGDCSDSVDTLFGGNGQVDGASEYGARINPNRRTKRRHGGGGSRR